MVKITYVPLRNNYRPNRCFSHRKKVHWRLFFVVVFVNEINTAAQVFAQTARLLWRENIAVLLNKFKSERQKQSGRTVSCTGKVLQQSRCHQNFMRSWTLLWKLLTKKNALKSRCFAALCERLDADNLQLLYHSDIRWLSRGCVLNRLFELRKEVHKFLEEQRSHLAEHYTDYQFCAKLAYLSDIFDQLNQLNVSMQGNSTVFMVSDKNWGIQEKLILWNRRVKEGRFDVSTSEWNFGSLFSCEHIKCHNLALVSVISKVCWLLPRGPLTWKPLDFGPILCGFCLRRCGSVHCVGKWTNGTADSSLKLQLPQVDLASFWLLAASEDPSVKAGNHISIAFHHHILMWVRVLHCDYHKIKSKEQTESYFGCYSPCQSLTHFTKTWSYYLQASKPKCLTEGMQNMHFVARFVSIYCIQVHLNKLECCGKVHLFQ